MPIVIQRNRASGLNELGQGMTGAVQNFLQGSRELARTQAESDRNAMRMGMYANQQQKEQQKEAVRQGIAQTLQSFDFKAPDAQDQLRKLYAQAPEVVAPLMNDYRQQQQFDENIALRKMMASQRGGQTPKQIYDSKLGGLINPDGSFTPVQLPEGYVPPAGAANDYLPLDAASRKEAFELRGQWDEAERVQNELDKFIASGETGGSGLFLGSLPSTVANRLDPSGGPLRGAISQMSSVIMHALSGAAVSEQERKRLEGFLPTAQDNLETIQQKMDGYKNYITTKSKSWQGTYGAAKPLSVIGMAKKANSANATQPTQQPQAPQAQQGGPSLPPGFKVVN